MTRGGKLKWLFARWRKCTLCPDLQSRNRVVVGEGDETCRWMIVGEAPGYLEDRRGRPFVGDSGHMLRNALTELKLPLPFITNTLGCRPPNNRDPDSEELLNCQPRLEALVNLIDPVVILIVGRVPFRSMLDTNGPIGAIRGTPSKYEFRWKGKWKSYTAVPVWHPAYILRNRTLEEEWKGDVGIVRGYL